MFIPNHQNDNISFVHPHVPSPKGVETSVSTGIPE